MSRTGILTKVTRSLHDQVMKASDFSSPEFTEASRIISENSHLTPEEINEKLAERGLPSVEERGAEGLKTLAVIIVPLILIGILTSITSFLDRST